MQKVTKKQILDLANYWATLLDIPNWDFEVKLVSLRELLKTFPTLNPKDNEYVASLYLDTERKSIIYVYKNVYLETIFKDILHEVLHIPFSPIEDFSSYITDKKAKDIFNLQIEKLINVVRDTVIKLNYKIMEKEK